MDNEKTSAIKKTCVLCVSSEQSGRRLDAALAEMFTVYGLRARRRLWEWCRVTVDGKIRKPAFRVQEGEKIMVEPVDDTEQMQNSSAMQIYMPKIVATGKDFIAFNKVSGIASATLAGGGNTNIDELLEKNWPDIWELFIREHNLEDKTLPPKPVLCNRLDAGTSGLITAAFSPDKADAFHIYEREGRVKKKYLALVHGLAPEYLLMDKALDTYRRKNTLVLQQKDQDFTRHTRAVFLKSINLESVSEREMLQKADQTEYAEQGWMAGLRYLMGLTGPFSLLEVTIQRGARHQIRAHLADAGFPIVGDVLYGLESSSRAERMFLHHFAITLPGFMARWLPDWDLNGVAFTAD